MSIWGKIVGGGVGFALGGPLGAFLGALAGHAYDAYVAPELEAGSGEAVADDPTRKIAFTIGVIALGAKMAKVDGYVTRDEVAAFKQVFRVPPEETANVARVFDIAKRDARGFEPYAQQLAKLLKDRPAVLEELLAGLFHIAKADGTVRPAELTYLEAVAHIFGFSGTEWHRIRASHLGPDKADPYTILGIARETSDDEARNAYRALVRQHHPDQLIAQGLPEEAVALATEKMATINAAWEQVRKARAL
jgi:DnaJ like chaperone protein